MITNNDTGIKSRLSSPKFSVDNIGEVFPLVHPLVADFCIGPDSLLLLLLQ
jgi:hypothetical protein